MKDATVRESLSYGMNTDITYRVFSDEPEELIQLAKQELIRLENQLSRFIPGSEICRINQAAGKGTVEISMETFQILSVATTLAEITQGYFDVTIGRLVELWDYKHSHDIPDRANIIETLHAVNYRDLLLNSHELTAGLSKEGQIIDLGGIGKGYASDRCMKILQENGVSSAFVNIGGNVSTLGNKPDGTPWAVGIRHPRHNDRLFGAVMVSGKAVVTSGDYERYFIDNEGTRRHHILNPITGYPSESGLTSVTVVADSAMLADALSTAIFVAGMDIGIGYLAHYPGAEAVLVDNDQKIYITKGLRSCFQAVDGLRAAII